MGSIYCQQYGIMIRGDHEGTRKGCEEHEGDNDQLRDSGSETELQGERGGAADRLPGVLPEPGERESVYGFDEEGMWF